MKNFLKSGLMVLLVATFAVPLSAFAERNLKIGLGDPIDSDQGVLALRFKEIVEKPVRDDTRSTFSLQGNSAMSKKWSKMQEGVPLMGQLLLSITSHLFLKKLVF